MSRALALAPRPLTQTFSFVSKAIPRSRVPGYPKTLVRMMPLSIRKRITPSALAVPKYGYVFRPAFELKQRVSWFPGHMAKTMRIIEESAIQQAQIVVEVRDARIPFTGMNSELDRVIQQRGKMRIVVLNKADLAGIGPGPKANRIAAEIKRYSPGVMDVVFTNCASQNTYRSGVKKVLNKILDNMPGKFKTTPRVVLVVGAPNVGKSTFINSMRRLFGMRKKGKAKAGGVPGITRSISGFRVHDDPPLILLDTPGVCPPRFNPGDHETPLRMAICGLIKDQILGSKTLADFLLYTLNRNGQFEYMKLGNLLAPSDDIDFVLTMIANKNTRSRDEEVGYVNEHNASGYLLKHFREGKLGQFMLDRLPSREAKLIKSIPAEVRQKQVFEAMQGHYKRFEEPKERLKQIFLEQTGLTPDQVKQITSS